MTLSHRRHFTAIALGATLMIGLWDGVRGVILPDFLQDLSISAATGGTIFGAAAFGYLIGSSAFGALAQRFGLRRVTAAGLLLFGGMVALFLTLRHPLLLVAANAGVGLAFPFVELSTQVPVSILYGDRQGPVLNLLHGFFGLGALLGSQFAALWLGGGFRWQVPTGLAGLLLALCVLYFLRLPPLPVPKPADNRGGYGTLLRSSIVWTATLALMAAVIAEMGMGTWLPYYLQEARGMPEAISAWGLSLFYFGFTGGRLAGGWLVDRLRPVPAVVLLALVGMASLLALILLPGVHLWLAALAGVGASIAFATCTALVATEYPEQVSKVYSVMYTAAGIAAVLTGPVMGSLGDRFGAQASMLVPLGGYLAMAALMGLYALAVRSARTARPDAA